MSDDSTPAVVWLYEADDDKTNQSCNANIFQNEPVGLALKKFRCYRVDVNAIADDRIRKEYEKQAPAFLFYDPAGEQVSKAQGRKVTSLSGFTGAMERTWKTSYKVNLRTYTKKMARILDRIDQITGKKQVLAQSKTRLISKPNPRKQKTLEQEERKLKAEEEKVFAEERELLASVQLRAQYQPETDKVAKSD
ncbi:MAG: hypothetical protein ACYS99_09485 [Planctomycetota bacterium]